MLIYPRGFFRKLYSTFVILLYQYFFKITLQKKRVDIINSEKVISCVELKYNDWSEWTSCTPTVDDDNPGGDPVAPNSRKRNRECSIPDNSCVEAILGGPEETELCPKWGDFSTWSHCSLSEDPTRTCQYETEKPTQVRRRECRNGEIGDSGCDKESDSFEEQYCEMTICCK